MGRDIPHFVEDRYPLPSTTGALVVNIYILSALEVPVIAQSWDPPFPQPLPSPFKRDKVKEMEADAVLDDCRIWNGNDKFAAVAAIHVLLAQDLVPEIP